MQDHDPRPLLGLCPIGKFVFSHEDAVRLKQELQAALRSWKVRFVDLDEVVPVGLVREQGHVDTVVRHFRNQQVDCLFLPHCNFGTEGAAGMIAHKLQVPTLLWGPRDEAPLADGSRRFFAVREKDAPVAITRWIRPNIIHHPKACSIPPQRLGNSPDLQTPIRR